MTITRPLAIAIITPCFNEADVLPISIPKLINCLGQLVEKHQCSNASYIVFVDDGSSDNTWDLIISASNQFPGMIRGIRLARNSGHQNALIAGLTYVNGLCDAAISIDVDLQDDLDALPRMLAKYREGAEIVLGVKLSRGDDSLTKSFMAKFFYHFMKWMGVNLVPDHADCRLLSSRALFNLSKFPESVLFLRGLQPLIHSRIATVEYHLADRPAGKSKYTFKKMFNLAASGITSFSNTPLRLISWIGASVFLISSLLALFAIISAFRGAVVPGWASITIPLYLLGGMLMLSIGIVGEYVAQVFLEVKKRPRFLVDEIACNNAHSDKNA